MWFDALIILGTCAAAVVFGFFVYWIIIKIQKTLRAHQLDSMQEKNQTPMTIAREIKKPSIEHPIKKTEHRPDIQKETDTETKDYDRLNEGVPRDSASAAKKEDDDWLNPDVKEVPTNVYKQQDDDWLNADVEEVPTNVYKQQDDDWLNSADDQSLVDEDNSSLDFSATRIPEIKIDQDGSTINIIVTTALNQDTKPDKKEDNSPVISEAEEIPADVIKQRDDEWLNAENDQPMETEVGPSLNLSPINQRKIQVKQDGFFLNIAVSATKKQDTKSEQTVTNLKINVPSQILTEEGEEPEEAEVIADYSPLYDESLQDIVPVKPVEEHVDQNSRLLDEITVRPLESQGERQKEDWGSSHVA